MYLAELWIALGILYYVGVHDVTPYRIISNGPFTIQEDCIKKVHKDVDRIRKMYVTQGYKLIDMYCVNVHSSNSVLNLPTGT